MMQKTLFLALLLCLLSNFNCFALGENLTVKIAVTGPGTELYFWWGHIALVIEDSVTGQGRFYDYGLFSFNAENFYTNFAFGRLLYCCGSSPTERSIAALINRNRNIVFYTLDLPPEKRAEVQAFVENNILPENRDYYYHHFRDNCSTRIRDIIDLATDGQFKDEFGLAPSRFTYRQHVRRHTWFSPAADWILNFWMGQDIDNPLTVWEDMFLPSEVGKRIADFSYTDSSGVRRKLVTREETIYRAEGRHAVLDAPRTQWPRELLFSLALSSLFGLCFFLEAKGRRAGRVLAGISMSLAGLVFGLAALALYFLSIFTNHDYTYHNANMLFASPLLLASVPLGVRYALLKDAGKRVSCAALLRMVWLLCVLGVFASMLIKLLPGRHQDNLTDQMLFLPIALVFALQPAGLKAVLKRYFRRGKKA